MYDDGEGAAAISMGLYRLEPGSAQVRQVTECPDETFVPHDSCSSTRLPDGSQLRLFKGTSIRTSASRPSSGPPTS